MATPRSQLIDAENALHYHIVSRCVRSSFLCGKDKRTGRNYEHRKAWLLGRLLHLAQHFSVAIDAYAIMDNHFHLVVYFDPKEPYRWSDEEVVERWFAVFPLRVSASEPREVAMLNTLHRQMMLGDDKRLQHARETLGSLSMFMKHLKQPIAYQANREDGCTGHFFEGRFYSGALLDESAVIAAMAYVDLNPVRARIVQDIADYEAASGSNRKRVSINSPERLAEAVAPLVSGLTYARPELNFTLSRYVEILIDVETQYQRASKRDKQSAWHQRISSLRKRQRAYGAMSLLSEWSADRNWSVRGMPLPAA